MQHRQPLGLPDDLKEDHLAHTLAEPQADARFDRADEMGGDRGDDERLAVDHRDERAQ